MTNTLIASLFTAALAIPVIAAPSAKGPGSGSIGNVALILPVQDTESSSTSQAGAVRAFPLLQADQLGGFQQAQDGTKFLLLRFQNSGATGIQVHLQSVRLGDGMRMFVYGMNSDGTAAKVYGPYTSAGPLQEGEFWSPIVAGDQAIVEFQTDGDVPADLPFQVDGVRQVSADSIAAAERMNIDTPADLTPQLQTSLYRGTELTHEVRDGLAIFENDIILGRADQMHTVSASKPGVVKHGVGVSYSLSLWPGGVMPYVIDPSLPNAQRVVDAIQAWNSALNGIVRIVPRTNQGNYALFFPSPNSYNCSSPVGMNSVGAQTTYLGDGCATGNVMHEIGHQLGLWHEHTRGDRNSHVTIEYQNIITADYFNFNQNTFNSRDLGAYDYNSIMHYPAFAFTANGQATIVTIPAGIPIGQRNGLSSGDVSAVATLYGGSVPAPTPTPTYVSITVNANPSGANVTVDGVTVGTPYSAQWLAGSQHTLAAGSQVPATGQTDTFSSWSDGGAASHTVTASTSYPVYTANFVVSYSLSTGTSPAGSGSVTVSPGATSFTSGSVVTLTATPIAGYCFSSWTGLIAGTPATTSISMTKPYAVTANFVSCPTPTPTPPPTTSTFVPIRVNAGGAAYTDPSGITWSGDYGYDGGSTYGANVPIANTNVPMLFQSERWSSVPFQYSFAVPNGTYNVVLRFAEIWFPIPGQRICNVLINGQQVLTNFDPATAAGGVRTAVDRTFSTNVTNGSIAIRFVPVVSNPKISAIQITQ